jgi:GT2 family glycosyltransferase
MAREQIEQAITSQPLSADLPSGAQVSDTATSGTLALPVVSLVIPTHNRCQSLRMVLEALTRQTTPASDYEVLVICDGCTDGTAAMCRELAVGYRLRVLEQTPNQGPAAARNRGVHEAAAPLILFIDDDVVPEPTLIAEHLRLHAQDERAVVIGTLLAPPGFRLNPWTRWEEAILRKQYADMAAGKWAPTARQFYTGNASVRREHILAAGGFNAQFRRAEDVELAYRFRDQHLRFYFNQDATGWHHALRSLRSWLTISTAYGQADVAMYRSGRLMTLQSMAREFHGRQPLLKRLARFCVGRPGRVRLAVGVLLALARLLDWLRQRRLSNAAYSAIFNLRYWQSVSDELGGAAAFWALVQQYQPAAQP